MSLSLLTGFFSIPSEMSAQSELTSKTKRVPFKDWKVVTKDDKSRRVSMLHHHRVTSHSGTLLK